MLYLYLKYLITIIKQTSIIRRRL